MTNADHQSDKIKILEKNIRNFFSRDGWATSTTLDDLSTIFKNNSFYSTDNLNINDAINTCLTEFTKAFIAGEDGDFDQFKAKLKSYDFSSTCGLVWTTNYFAYRCRTCCLSPSMSLCSACFNNGNHVGHDFNKFKSQAGGACDCGNPYVMKEFGYCKHHGPGKLSQQREPPKDLILRLQMVMPIYLKCVLFACWSLIQNIDMDDSSINLPSSSSNSSDVLVTPFALINDLLSCGWAVQKMLAGIMGDKVLFQKFISDVCSTDQYYSYQAAMLSNPGFKFPADKVGSQELNHQNFVDAFLFVCVKLRFPENLITFLIGLLTMETYKDVFVHSYLNHYSRMASTILIHAKTVRNGQDASYNMNNRIVHISVQLFSGEILALKMVKERDLHYLIVHCLINMFGTALTRLDSKDNYVINCETPMIQNNVFWPLISDLTNLVTHKSVVDYFLSDSDFMRDWTHLLRIMQFMNFFVLKEGNHIEYETMAFFHAYTMEIEISANSMWNLWYHYRSENDRDNALKLVRLFVTALSDFLQNLGTFHTSVTPHPARKPLSFHLPLMRNVACFVSLGLVYHNIPLSSLLDKISNTQIVRWFEETINTLLGCQEVLIGYWVRNGQSVRTSTTYYIHSQFCYALIDMDIFAAQICAATLPSSTVIYLLTDPSQLLKGINFTLKCEHHSEALTFYDQHKELATQNRNRNEKISLERQPLALESWLVNLCWLLDLRNEMSTNDMAKLRKEVCCELCPEPIKRSDLSHRLPEKTGINFQVSPDVDSILKEVANYTAPTFDEYSGNLQSGLYTFKPELWDSDYDPLFQSLRSVTKRDAADALSKYREYYRQKQNVAQANSLWPPYRSPEPPHPQLSDLEKILHCKDLSYMLFCCLNMFINNDPAVTEDSLALVVHLILRSLSVPEPDDSLEESFTSFSSNRFPNNQYKVNNAWSNLRYKVELFADIIQGNKFSALNLENENTILMETEPNIISPSYTAPLAIYPKRSDSQSSTSFVIQRESILSLLLKVHSRLHIFRIQSGGKSLLVDDPNIIKTSNPNTQSAASTSILQSKLMHVQSGNDDIHELDETIEPMDTTEEFNAIATPPDALQRKSVLSKLVDSHKNSSNRQGHSLDLKSIDYFKVYPLVYRYRPQNLEKTEKTGVGVNWGDGVDFIGHLLDIIASKNDENSKALLELIGMIEETMKPKVNITTQKPSSDYKNIASFKLSAEEAASAEAADITKSFGPKSGMLDPMQEKKQKALDRRRRVIANMAQKQKDFATAHQIDLAPPDVPLMEDEEEQMYECVICQLKSNPSKEKMVLLGLLCSSGTLKYMYSQCPSFNTTGMVIHRRKYCQNLRLNLPILSHGMIIQTCGHVVHQDCFDKYKAQRPAVTRMRRTITCPLCRRDVHHLTPITANQELDSSRSPSSLTSLGESLLTLMTSCSPQHIVTHTIEEAIAKSQLGHLITGNEACCLLRSQMELDLIICLTATDQYTSVARRCLWPQFIAYLRTLNTNIPLVIYQLDTLFGTDFWSKISHKEDYDCSNPLLLQCPSDVLLNVIPYIWPSETMFNFILKSCLLLAYVKGLVFTSIKLDCISHSHWSKLEDEPNLFRKQFLSILIKSVSLRLGPDSPEPIPQPPLLTDSLSIIQLSTDEILQNLEKFLTPILRFAAILKLRLQSVTQIPPEFPIQPEEKAPMVEFYTLLNYLELLDRSISITTMTSQTSTQQLNHIASIMSDILQVDEDCSFDSLLDRLITEDFILEYNNEKHNITFLDILNLGNELYPPKLIELPNCYDDLFNTNHAQKCTNEKKPSAHNFPENGLCLICGKLICLICDGMPQAFNDHTKNCCYGVGLIIDVNTSIIHVLLNNEISQWGSVYLDYYGEEDLELKRGRPLFINTRRFKLLEQQWLTHSFKHVVKFWRRLT